jgi:hypothetical protein
VLLFVMSMPAFAENNVNLGALLKTNFSDFYVVPDDESFAKAQKLFAEYFQGKNTEKSVKEWKSLGFSISNYSAGGQDYFIIAEDAEAKKGGGIYAIKNGIKDAPLLVQAPHQDSDLHTGKLLLGIIESGKIDAASWNTISRKNTDMGKAPDSYFAAFTTAFAASFPQGKLIQVHGFTPEKRKEKTAASIIVSSGTKTPNNIATQAKECLAKVDYIKDEALLYPVDTKELGGTKNISAKILREHGNNEFLHIEMNYELRKKWSSNTNLVKDLLECIK